MTQSRFDKPFTNQEPIDEETIAEVADLLRTGRLHRYNTLGDELSQAALLEREYAAYQGVKYCIACASGGYALHVALRALGLEKGDRILANAYTLAPVPGAIHNAGGVPVFVEIDRNWHIDLEDLESKARESGAKYLMLSHMRGHIADMDAICALCERYGIQMVEDCAHTMGAKWKGTRSGNFGAVACFSAQTYKHINSGEGGLLTTDDDEVAARAIIHSGSYMLYERHGTVPPKSVFDRIKLQVPNYSGRMDNLRALLLRRQLHTLDENVGRWNARYSALEAAMRDQRGLRVVPRAQHESFVGSSFQFQLEAAGSDAVRGFLQRCLARGVEVKWFGEDQPNAFTSRYDSWRYLEDLPDLPKTKSVLSGTCDIRVPLTFSVADCRLIGDIIAEEAAVL